jgi:hypothetical protein
LRVWDGEQSLLNPEWVRGSFVADILRYVYYGATDKTAVSRARASSNSWTDNLISDIADSLDKRYVRTDDLCDELAGVFEDDLTGWPLFFVDVDPDFVRDVVDAGLDRGSAAVLQVDADRLLSDRGPYSGRVLYVFSGTAQIALLPRSENLLSLYRYNPYITRRWERRRDRDLAASVKLAPPPGRARSRLVLVGVAHRAIIPELLKNVFGLRTDEYDVWLRDTLGAADENHVPLPPLLEEEERLLLARRQRLDLLSDPGVPFKLRSDEEGELLPGTRVQLHLRSDHRLSTRLQRLNYTHLDRRSGLSIRATDSSGRTLTGSLEQCVSADTQEYLDVDVKSVEPGFEEAGTCRVVDEGCDAVIRSEETLLRDLYFGLSCGSVEVPALRAWRLLEPFAGVDVLGERSNATLWSGKMRAAAVDECHTEEQTEVTLYEEMFGGANGRPPIQVLTGAPGTGKTRVAASLADLFLSRNRDRAYPPARVLVVAASHFAIDNFLRTFRVLASVDARIYRHVPPARVDQLRNSRVLDAVLHDEIAQEWERHRSELPPVRARSAERVNLNEYVASLETNIASLPVSGGNGTPVRRVFIPSHERWRKTKNGECSWLSEREPHFQRSYLVSKRDEFSKLRDGGEAAIHEETRSDRLYRQFAADIVATTPDAFDRLPDLHYDLVVFEEASQLTGLKLLKVMAKVLRPLERDACPRILLSGDRAQLPPFLETFSDAGEAADPESDDRFWSLLEEYRILQSLRTKETIFDRICDRASVKTLRVQRRMHPQIASLINSLFYSDQQWRCVGNKDPAGGVLWLDTSLKQAKPEKQGASLYNQAEIDAIREFVNGISDSDDRVLVIAPDAAQVRMLIRDLGASVTVRTIDGCQGIEADIVVVSFVSLRLTEKSRFVVEPRRMNVAMSRARTRLVLVGDFQSLDAARRAAVGDPRLAHLSGLVALFGPRGPFGTCRRVLPA